MKENVFQIIYDKIIVFLPEDWKELIFFAGYTNDSYQMKFYFKNNSLKYSSCFDLKDISNVTLIKLFVDLDKYLSEDRTMHGKEKVWTVFTMKVYANGSFNTKYEYDDHSEDMIGYQQQWEKENLI